MDSVFSFYYLIKKSSTTNTRVSLSIISDPKCICSQYLLFNGVHSSLIFHSKG
ncbi:hypothetical protein PROSTU_00882 [Providencia stuartii ATCC 25827]|uniref:Uncharacterized protein n=1 Tax=Providencia stuartii ATCC 25827 TaxID=471874 RepID=A0AA86YNH7_PROST|nr:hypothetical protein PROSTU_00882 [Providencia stuartii ATCC 25827]